MIYHDYIALLIRVAVCRVDYLVVRCDGCAGIIYTQRVGGGGRNLLFFFIISSSMCSQLHSDRVIYISPSIILCGLVFSLLNINIEGGSRLNGGGISGLYSENMRIAASYYTSCG